MMEDEWFAQRGDPSADPQDSPETITVIGKRMPATSSASGGGGRPAIIVNVGGTNAPSDGLVELLRGLITDRTDFDLDPAFTPKQRDIILKALQGLADHPDFAEAFAAMLDKGADVNIVADFSGRNTGSNLGILVGKNADGTVDRGESMTIYINMNYAGEPTSDRSFANTIVHELLHTLGDPYLDGLLDATNSTYDKGPTRDIFSNYDYQAPAVGTLSGASIISVPAGGGSVSGDATMSVYNGSDAADSIVVGSGGGLIFSGAGDDRVIVSGTAPAVEIIDAAGLDTIELAAGTGIGDVSLRWSVDGSEMAVLIGGVPKVAILGAAGGGAIENIAVDGSDLPMSAFVISLNNAPVANGFSATVYGSFQGGWLADGSASDADGDALSYRLETVSGEYAEAAWAVDRVTGAISGNFERGAQAGSAYSIVTLSVTDGIDETTFTQTVRWGNRNEVPTPIEFRQGPDDVDLAQGQVSVQRLPDQIGDIGMTHV